MARRPKILGWLPAVILSVAIIGVGAAAVVLVQNGLGEPAPKPTQGQVTDLNWSIFTPAGQEYIRSTRELRFDFSNGPAEAAPLGLPDDGTLVFEPIDNGDTFLDYDLIINGGGEGAGGDRFIVSQVTIITEDGFVTHVTAPLREILNFRQTLTKMQKKADLFGWDVSGVDQIIEDVGDATRAGEPYSFTFGPADKAGVPVAATATCDQSGGCVLEYDVTPPVR